MKKLSSPLALLLTLVLLGVISSMALALPGDRYTYDEPGDKDYTTNTNALERFFPGGSNNMSYKVTSPRAEADAAFTTDTIVVDGVRESAWDAATSHPISNKYNTAMTADNPTATTEGILRTLWDGPVLYVLVEVSGDSSQSDSATPNWNVASYTPNSDGLFVFMDPFNDQWGMETDTQGVFFLGANPLLTSVTSFNNGGIPSLGSFFNPNNQDYSTRLKAFKSSGYSAGPGVNYTYEIALQIEGWGDEWNRDLKNGTDIGLEVGIFDQLSSFTYWSKTEYFAGREGSSNLPNSERVRNRDWGVVSLAGWNGTAPFAYSGWRADEDIRFWNSKNNPGGSGNGTSVSNNGDGSLVWTPASKASMMAAKAAYLDIKDSVAATRAEKEEAVLDVAEAFAGLRWGDTRYPDPHDLPVLHTVPDPFKFFDNTKGTNGKVTTLAEWEERKQEILELAQFYEYGYKPKLGVDYTINITTNAYAGTGNATVIAQVIPTNVNYSGGVTTNVTVTVTMPASAPGGQKAVVAFGGGYTANGIANIGFPNWAGDNRTDNGAWGNPNRGGTFYTIFPYARNSTSADSSILIANATGVSVYLDILEAAVAANSNLAAKIDPTQAVTKGFSIGGKNAFVAAIYDDRVKAVVNGGSGATGPANWRYNVQGQEYDFTGTIFYNPGAEAIVAHGTEGPGNSYRHNRVRETELFRHFMSYGHMYSHADGSYAYGNYGRLPYDQALLVATLAPDRAIMINTNLNDYNDGSTTDNMSLAISKGVYSALGVNGDDFVKFNNGTYRSSGDPHGAAAATPEGKYLSDLFYGTSTLSDAEAEKLNTDPYSLLVTNDQTESPYDFYWGGYNTITGGEDGISGTDGWYYQVIDGAHVDTAIEAIGGATYEIPYTERTNQGTKTAWVQTAVDDQIPFGNGATAIVEFDGGVYTAQVTKGLKSGSTVLTVTEQLSPVNDLASITVSAGTLDPTFNAGTTEYSVDVPYLVTTFHVAPALADIRATLAVNGDPVSSGQDSPSTNLAVGDNPFSIVVTAEDGTLKTYTVTANRLTPEETIFLSPTRKTKLDGVAYQDEDILIYDALTGNWSLYFDGSDVNLSSVNLNALRLEDDGSILISLDKATTRLPGMNNETVDDSDIVRFVPTSLGENTAGSFEMYFDGSDVGLTKVGEDIDAIGLTPEGILVISTVAKTTVPATAGGDLKVEDEDLIVFTASSLGSTTAGTWDLYVDGSDIHKEVKYIAGVWIDANNGDILLTFGKRAVLDTLTVQPYDILRCVPSSLGSTTSCASLDIFWSGAAHGFDGTTKKIDAFSVQPN